MWLRNTLVFREGDSWEVVGFCKHIAGTRHNLEENFFTLRALWKSSRWRTNMQCRVNILTFSCMAGRSTANLENAQADAQSDDGYSASIRPDPVPDEAPADRADAEPLEEDRVVQFSEDSETVVAHGILMTHDCTLKILRSGCSALGCQAEVAKGSV
jgi:hypothetical protein